MKTKIKPIILIISSVVLLFSLSFKNANATVNNQFIIEIFRNGTLNEELSTTVKNINEYTFTIDKPGGDYEIHVTSKKGDIIGNTKIINLNTTLFPQVRPNGAIIYGTPTETGNITVIARDEFDAQNSCDIGIGNEELPGEVSCTLQEYYMPEHPEDQAVSQQSLSYSCPFECPLSTPPTGATPWEEPPTQPSAGGNTTPTESICGNGIKEGNEQCDGSAGTATNPANSGQNRRYACIPAGQQNECTFTGGWCGDTASNGDNIIQENKGELCDGNNLNNQTCNSLDYINLVTSNLLCTNECDFDTSSCGERCLDTELCSTENIDDNCDGNINEGCENQPPINGGGDTDPGNNTGGDTSGNLCNNDEDIINPGEECDGNNLNNQTCGTLGYINTQALPLCNNECEFVFTPCGERCLENEICNNGQDDNCQNGVDEEPCEELPTDCTASGEEICNNGIDDNCQDGIDEPDCIIEDCTSIGYEICNNNINDNCNGETDEQPCQTESANNPPIFIDPPQTIEVRTNEDPIIPPITATDPEDGNITYTIENGPSGLTINENTGLLTNDDVPIGTHQVVIVATDDTGNETRITIRLQINNYCGDGIIQNTGTGNNYEGIDNEQCDTNNLNNQTCGTLNYSNASTLPTCNANCTFNTSACGNLCVPETCNGQDDNCNTQIDEVFPVGEICTVGQGICERSSSYVCSANGLGVECPITPGPSQVEICDGVADEDCDGLPDASDPDCECINGSTQNYGTTNTNAGQCQIGQQTCQDGHWVTTTPEIQAVPELCLITDIDGNLIDEDCDGTADENCIPTPVSITIGDRAETQSTDGSTYQNDSFEIYVDGALAGTTDVDPAVGIYEAEISTLTIGSHIIKIVLYKEIEMENGIITKTIIEQGDTAFGTAGININSNNVTVNRVSCLDSNAYCCQGPRVAAISGECNSLHDRTMLHKIGTFFEVTITVNE